MDHSPNNIPREHLIAISAVAAVFGRFACVTRITSADDQPLARFEPATSSRSRWLDRTWKQPARAFDRSTRPFGSQS